MSIILSDPRNLQPVEAGSGLNRETDNNAQSITLPSHPAGAGDSNKPVPLIQRSGCCMAEIVDGEWCGECLADDPEVIEFEDPACPPMFSPDVAIGAYAQPAWPDAEDYAAICVLTFIVMCVLVILGAIQK